MPRPPPVRAALFALALTPAPAGADSLTLTLVPSPNPDSTIGCVLLRTGAMMRALEVTGPGLPAPTPRRWVLSPTETARLDAGFAALASGRVPRIDPEGAAVPRPPFALLVWTRDEDAGTRTGLMMQQGLALPRSLDDLLRDLMPGSRCDRTVRPAAPPPAR